MIKYNTSIVRIRSVLFFIAALLQIIPLKGNSNEEFRATWVITWDHISSGNSVDENKARIREIMEDHLNANMTSVLFQVRQSGTAYYNSSFEPWGYYAGYQHPGYDPLEYAIEQAHLRGLELHAWFNVFQTSSLHTDTLSSEEIVGSPAAIHPEWVCRNRDGNPMTSYRSISPGLEEVRAYTINVAMEIVQNYDIDGLHLDYIRWNEYTSSTASPEYNGGQIEEIGMMDGIFSDSQYQANSRDQTGRYLYDYLHPYSNGVPQGFSSWEDWWQKNVTEFVQSLHDSMQTVKPYVRLSVAALGRYNWGVWQGLGDVYQDAALWFNEGYIDQLTPMHYHWTTGSSFYSMLEGGCPQCWSDFIQEGILAKRIYSVGPASYILHDNNIWENHSQIIQSSRNVEWVDGFQFFSSGTWDFYDYWGDAGEEIFARKTKIRFVPSNNSTTPPSPELALTTIDSLTHEIQIIPSGSTENNWFILYRSEDESIDDSTGEIVNVHFGKDTFIVIQSFTGLQNFDGAYTYSASQLDRHWNESTLSITVTADSIPSFPPAIISSIPQSEDTISVHSGLILHFSKTIDSITIQNAVSIEPEETYQIELSQNGKSLAIEFPLPLDYDTLYTLKIDSSLTDVNGRRLDGNADGNGGDSFFLQFYTEQEDVYGPTLIQSDINFEMQSSDIDLDAPLTFVFDEDINPSSLSSSISWTSSNEVVTFDDILVNRDSRSIYSIRAEDFLPQITDFLFIINSSLTDTLGNAFVPDTALFTSSRKKYTDVTLIDAFNSVTNWWDPNGSGSTTGILAGSGFGTNTQIYLPRTSPYKSAQLTYEWDQSASYHLLREYLSGGPPRSVIFDTTVTLQCFIFGDNSQNKFRFCIDEKSNGSWSGHEVANWTTIDWYGWRLVEWQLQNPESVGSWIGNGVLDGTDYRFDSFQLSFDSDYGDPEGAVYFDDLRIVTKSSELAVNGSNPEISDQFSLEQNYPNPFNAVTNITFSIPKFGYYMITIFDLRGREVKSLVSTFLETGQHSVRWNGLNNSGIPVSSGLYLYRLNGTFGSITKQMLLVK